MTVLGIAGMAFLRKSNEEYLKERGEERGSIQKWLDVHDC